MKSIHLLLIAVILVSDNNGTKELDQLIQNGEFSEAIKIIGFKLKNKATASIKETNVLQGKLNEISSGIQMTHINLLD